MSDIGLDDVVALTDRMYETVYDDGQWADVVGEFKSRLNASNGAVGFVDASALTMHMLHADCDPEYGPLCYSPELANPLVPRLFNAPAGDVCTDESVMPKQELVKTRFFNEWFRPQGEHSALNMKPLQGNVSAHLMLLRGGSQPAFDEHDVAFAHKIMPTLMRVAHLRTKVGALQLAGEARAYEKLNVGFVVAEGNGRILLSNAVADQMLGRPQYGLDAPKGQLTVRSTAERSTLRKIIADACTDLNGILGQGGDMLVSDPSTGQPAVSLSVAPIRDAGAMGLSVGRAAAIFIQDLALRLPPRFEARMQAMFGLTGKEAALAAALTSGQTLKEAAEDRFISMPTARTQLAQIFRKTHTSQQSQLVSLLLGILPVGR